MLAGFWSKEQKEECGDVVLEDLFWGDSLCGMLTHVLWLIGASHSCPLFSSHIGSFAAYLPFKIEFGVHGPATFIGRTWSHMMQNMGNEAATTQHRRHTFSHVKVSSRIAAKGCMQQLPYDYHSHRKPTSRVTTTRAAKVPDCSACLLLAYRAAGTDCWTQEMPQDDLP